MTVASHLAPVHGETPDLRRQKTGQPAKDGLPVGPLDRRFRPGTPMTRCKTGRLRKPIETGMQERKPLATLGTRKNRNGVNALTWARHAVLAQNARKLLMPERTSGSSRKDRSEERRVGKEGVRTCRYRW